MNKKRKIMLAIYGVIIIVILVFILFIAPDSMFTGKYEDFDIPNDFIKKEFVPYETQINNLLNNKYKYEYMILDSMRSVSYRFECSGEVNEDLEIGACTLPERVSYTETSKEEVFKNIDTNYLNVSYLFNILNDLEYKEDKYNSYREYNYTMQIKDLETEVVVKTDYDEITEILISNAYMTYILKFSDVQH